MTVKSGDILVGKITPKGETELSAEERLLRAIFGEKAKDVRDTSLYLEHGEHGKVIDIKIFSRSGARKDKRYKEDATRKVEKLERSLEKQILALQSEIKNKLSGDPYFVALVNKITQDIVNLRVQGQTIE